MYINDLPIEALIPIIEMCKEYFDNKYPCDTDDNCGDDMCTEDVWKKRIYDKLINFYHEEKDKIDERTLNLYARLRKINIKP